MCLHYSFENLTLKLQNKVLFSVEDQVKFYCTGSRNHGCQGCFCRRPYFRSYRQSCGNCGKLFLDILDALWYVRQEVYRKHALNELKNYDWVDLFLVEYAIEEKLNRKIQEMDILPTLNRSALLKLHVDAAEQAKEEVLLAESTWVKV